MKTRCTAFAISIVILLVHGALPADALSRPQNRARRSKPYAYLFAAAMQELTEHLQRAGIEVCELREDIDLEVDVHRIAGVTTSGSGAQEGRSFRFETDRERQTRRFEAGTILVKAEQRLDASARRVLTPHARKSRRLRGLLGRLREGDLYPVYSLGSYVPMTHGPVRPLRADREPNKPVTFETLYGREKRVDFGGSPVRIRDWLNGEHYLQARDGRLYEVHAASGSSILFVDPNVIREALRRLPAMREKDAESLAKRTSFHMSPDHDAMLFDYENDLYYCTRNGRVACRLTSTPGQEQYATFDPAGNFVAFVRDQNLFVVDVATQTERALTTDGGGMIRNGQADWVYFEEVFSRQWKVFWWSPDSSAIAFLRTDDTPVPGFTVVHNTSADQQVELTPYPRAGEPNPHVTLGIVSTAGGPVRWVDLDEYLDGAYLVTGVQWMPDSDKLSFFIQDRAQRWLDIDMVAKGGGAPKRLLRETTEAWVEPPTVLTFLQDGCFLLSSERTGWKHLYLYDKNAQLKHAVTQGPWEVRSLHHVDENAGWVYVTGTRDSHVAEHLYRVRLTGGEPERLTQPAGHHEVSVSPDGSQYVDRWSNYSTPTRVALCTRDGTHVRTLDTNPVYERLEYRFGAYEQFQIEMSDGFPLEASLLKPPDFTADKKYPAWFMTYGGPHAPTISDSWRGGRAYDHMLAQMGILVFRCDPRSASGKGACSAWSAYRQLGVQELKDIDEAIAWLKQQPYVDGQRIGISGHSYGGFLTAYVLTHSEQFAGGIAGAPVTDWHLYDSIYTERYMDTPQENPEGYAKTSVVQAAAKLHGRLLLLHGATDDNVHLENTFKLVDAMQRADKTFELMIYPRSRHGVGGSHYNRLTVDFIRSVLDLPDASTAAATEDTDP